MRVKKKNPNLREREKTSCGNGSIYAISAFLWFFRSFWDLFPRGEVDITLFGSQRNVRRLFALRPGWFVIARAPSLSWIPLMLFFVSAKRSLVFRSTRTLISRTSRLTSITRSLPSRTNACAVWSFRWTVQELLYEAPFFRLRNSSKSSVWA